MPTPKDECRQRPTKGLAGKPSAYIQGALARRAAVDESDNPYASKDYSNERTQWFSGWYGERYGTHDL